MTLRRLPLLLLLAAFLFFCSGALGLGYELIWIRKAALVVGASQIALANEVMSPSDAEIEKAKRILSAMAEAEAAGKGAVSLDGRLIDYASIRQAEVLVEKAKQISG